MKTQIASDLHLEVIEGHIPGPSAFWRVPERDLLILADDIGPHLVAKDFVLSYCSPNGSPWDRGQCRGLVVIR